MRESAIESYLVAQVKKAGGKAYKWVSPGNRGVPDRIVIFPYNELHFVELKASGKGFGPQQKIQRDQLNKFGYAVWLIDSKDGVDRFITWQRSQN